MWWLQYLSMACGSIGCRLWLQSPVSPVVHGSSSICCISCRLSHLVTPAAVVCGSSSTICSCCCLWLRYLLSSWLRYLLSISSCGSRQYLSSHLWLQFVAPLSVVRGSSSSRCCRCTCGSSISVVVVSRLLLPAVAPVSVDRLWLQY